jgi:hypothetical protein
MPQLERWRVAGYPPPRGALAPLGVTLAPKQWQVPGIPQHSGQDRDPRVASICSSFQTRPSCVNHRYDHRLAGPLYSPTSSLARPVLGIHDRLRLGCGWSHDAECRGPSTLMPATSPSWPMIIDSAISSARRRRGRPPLVGAGAEEASPRHRSRHELDEQGTGWPGPWHRWQAEVRVRRCGHSIQSADHAVHEHAPGDPKVSGVIIDFESDLSIALRQLGQRATWRGLEEESMTSAQAIVNGNDL